MNVSVDAATLLHFLAYANVLVGLVLGYVMCRYAWRLWPHYDELERRRWWAHFSLLFILVIGGFESFVLEGNNPGARTLLITYGMWLNWQFGSHKLKSINDDPLHLLFGAKLRRKGRRGNRGEDWS